MVLSKHPIAVACALTCAQLMSSVVHARTEPYDAIAAVNYAKSWAKHRNWTYPDLSAHSGGGDCTNFISQALQAGGFRNTVTDKPTSDQRWYFVSKTSYSQTWSSAHGLYNRFKNGYENWVKWDGMSSLNYGDIVFADWNGDNQIDHTMIVTGFKAGSFEPLLTYHSEDRLNSPRSVVMQAGGSKAKYYRFGISDQCLAVQKSQIVS